MNITIPDPDPNFCESCLFNCGDCGTCQIYGYGPKVGETCRNDKDRQLMKDHIRIYYEGDLKWDF